ncbi:MAG: hypothetical protein C5S48_10205 [Candidatus Methanogaster sp.]|nr:MAG: hypothetical protein C5S48_10205 [ANME-2 cluster archaeon]
MSAPYTQTVNVLVASVASNSMGGTATIVVYPSFARLYKTSVWSAHLQKRLDPADARLRCGTECKFCLMIAGNEHSDAIFSLAVTRCGTNRIRAAQSPRCTIPYSGSREDVQNPRLTSRRIRRLVLGCADRIRARCSSRCWLSWFPSIRERVCRWEV